MAILDPEIIIPNADISTLDPFIPLAQLTLDNGNIAYLYRPQFSGPVLLKIVDWLTQTVIHTSTIAAAPISGGGLIKCQNGTFWVVGIGGVWFAQLRHADGTSTVFANAVIPGFVGYTASDLADGRVIGVEQNLDDQIWLFPRSIEGGGSQRGMRAVWLQFLPGGSITVNDNLLIDIDAVSGVDRPSISGAVNTTAGFALSWYRVTGTSLYTVLQEFAWTGIATSPQYPLVDGFEIRSISASQGVLIASATGETASGTALDVYLQDVVFNITSITFGVAHLITTIYDYIVWGQTGGLGLEIVQSTTSETGKIAFAWATSTTRIPTVVTVNFATMTVLNVSTWTPAAPDPPLALSGLVSIYGAGNTVFTCASNALYGTPSAWWYAISYMTPTARRPTIPLWGYSIISLACTPCAPMQYDGDGWIGMYSEERYG